MRAVEHAFDGADDARAQARGAQQMLLGVGGADHGEDDGRNVGAEADVVVAMMAAVVASLSHVGRAMNDLDLRRRLLAATRASTSICSAVVSTIDFVEVIALI